MYRSAAANARSALRASSQSSLAPARTAAGRRFITTEPPHAKSRSWKNSALRWGVAAAGLYYYNTSPVFAEHPQHNLLNPNVDALADERETSTIDQLTASSRARAQKDASVLQSAIETTSAIDASPDTAHLEHSVLAPAPAEIPAPETGDAAALEAEAEGEGAFNPITGEINWDCPCLGGMAYGPCGEEFRAAFSCFVYSQEEPKGMECIDKFQGMQDCFRANPEHYKAELEDDLEAEASGELQQQREELEKEVQERRAQVQAQQEAKQKEEEESEKPAPKKKSKAKQPKESKSSETSPKQPKQRKESESPEAAQPETKQQSKPASPSTPSPEAQSESEGLVPKAAHDARS